MKALYQRASLYVAYVIDFRRRSRYYECKSSRCVAAVAIIYSAQCGDHARTRSERGKPPLLSLSLSFFPPFPSLFPPKAQHAHVHTLQTDSRLAKRERKFGLLGRRRRRRGALAAPLLLPTAPMLHVEFMNSLLKRKRKFPNKPKRAAAAAAAAQTMKRWRWKPRSTVQYIGRNVDCLPCSYLSKISS